MYINGIRYHKTEDVRKLVVLDSGNANELESMQYKCVAASYRRGYIRKNHCILVPYDGRYGKGYTVHTYHPISTNYHLVQYFIRVGVPDTI